MVVMEKSQFFRWAGHWGVVKLVCTGGEEKSNVVSVEKVEDKRREVNNKLDHRDYDRSVWMGVICLLTGTCEGLLLARQ
jgi:hypothetical protein